MAIIVGFNFERCTGRGARFSSAALKNRGGRFPFKSRGAIEGGYFYINVLRFNLRAPSPEAKRGICRREVLVSIKNCGGILLKKPP